MVFLLGVMKAQYFYKQRAIRTGPLVTDTLKNVMHLCDSKNSVRLCLVSWLCYNFMGYANKRIPLNILYNEEEICDSE